MAMHFTAASLQHATSNYTIGGGTGDFTIECWFYIDATNTSWMRIFCDAANSTGIRLDIVRSGHPSQANQIFFVSNNTSDTGIFGTTTPSTGTWYYVSARWNSSTKVETLACFKTDGTKLFTNVVSAAETLGRLISSNSIWAQGDGGAVTDFDGRMRNGWIGLYVASDADSQVRMLESRPQTAGPTAAGAFWPLADGSDTRELVSGQNLTLAATPTTSVDVPNITHRL